MATCPLTSECLFYTGKTTATPEAVAKAKGQFCDGDYEGCARYKVADAAGADGVPADLMPDMVGRAEVLIAEGETIRFRSPKGKQGKKA